MGLYSVSEFSVGVGTWNPWIVRWPRIKRYETSYDLGVRVRFLDSHFHITWKMPPVFLPSLRGRLLFSLFRLRVIKRRAM